MEVELRAGGAGGNVVKDLALTQEGGSEAVARTYFSFKSVGEASCLSKDKGLKESLLQWSVHY